MKIFAVVFGCVCLALILYGAKAQAAEPIIVHEWGTFTSLQDEGGQAIGGINVDDEPVPDFVWGNESLRNLTRGASLGLPPYEDRSKGWRPADHEVTMRLETPVLYFYPPKGTPVASIPLLQVHVDFHGGVLSQYYPFATAAGWSGTYPLETRPLAQINSSLDWKDVRLGSTLTPIATQDKVWTTPRATGAAMLEVPSPSFYNGQEVWKPIAEKFLFYRGLGHLDSPLFLNGTSLTPGQKQDIFPWVHHMIASSSSLGTHEVGNTNSDAWLADIHTDGSCRWEFLPMVLDSSGERVGGKFFAHERSKNNLAELQASMHDALVGEGLYDDEATAMLKTWELSYFKSPGLRFFYIVPRAWTEQVLPLTITGAPTRITRVMIGRIELISDEQKATLARLAAGPCPNLAAIRAAAIEALQHGKLTDEEKQAFIRGEKSLTELGIALPPPVRDYLSLGRFRDALIVHEQQQHPSAALAAFIHDNQLAPTSE